MEFASQGSISKALMMNNSLDSFNTSFFEFSNRGGGNPDPNPSTISLESWLQLHRNNHLAPNGRSNDADQVMQSTENQEFAVADGAQAHHGYFNSEATSVTSKALPAAISGHLCVNGATAKVSKKRSRASRRPPTTMLRTDPSNFRAMVQQFTGIPLSPFASMPSQEPLIGSSFSNAAHLSYNNTQHPHPYSFFFQDDMNSAPFYFPSDADSHRGQPPPLDDVMGLNPASAYAFSNPVMLSSERRPGYLI